MGSMGYRIFHPDSTVLINRNATLKDELQDMRTVQNYLLAIWIVGSAIALKSVQSSTDVSNTVLYKDTKQKKVWHFWWKKWE